MIVVPLFIGLLGIATPAVAAPTPASCAVTLVAHRALGGEAPENTLSAIDEALRQGVQVIEIDVRTARDGALVVIHDATVDRTTNGHGRVADLTLAELKALDAGMRAGPAHRGARIPTFDKVLGRVRHSPARLLVDVKSRVDLGRLVGQIGAQRMGSRTIVGLRMPGDIARLRKLAPRIETLALIREAADAPAFAKAGTNHIRLWSDWIDPQTGGDPQLVARVRSLGVGIWAMVGRRLPRRGAEWKALHARLAGAGVDAIMTDRPDPAQFAC